MDVCGVTTSGIDGSRTTADTSLSLTLSSNTLSMVFDESGR
jgi:hypothetical protein